MLLIPTSNFFYWLVINALIGSSVSSLFPYLMVAFSMNPAHLKNSSTFRSCSNRRLVFAAFGPILFGYSKSLFHSWTPAILMLLVLTIIMAIALYQVEKVDHIL